MRNVESDLLPRLKPTNFKEIAARNQLKKKLDAKPAPKAFQKKNPSTATKTNDRVRLPVGASSFAPADRGARSTNYFQSDAIADGDEESLALALKLSALDEKESASAPATKSEGKGSAKNHRKTVSAKSAAKVGSSDPRRELPQPVSVRSRGSSTIEGKGPPAAKAASAQKESGSRSNVTAQPRSTSSSTLSNPPQRRGDTTDRGRSLLANHLRGTGTLPEWLAASVNEVTQDHLLDLAIRNSLLDSDTRPQGVMRGDERMQQEEMAWFEDDRLEEEERTIRAAEPMRAPPEPVVEYCEEDEMLARALHESLNGF